jgi:hypothetical protein
MLNKNAVVQIHPSSPELSLKHLMLFFDSVCMTTDYINSMHSALDAGQKNFEYNGQFHDIRQKITETEFLEEHGLVYFFSLSNEEPSTEEESRVYNYIEELNKTFVSQMPERPWALNDIVPYDIFYDMAVRIGQYSMLKEGAKNLYPILLNEPMYEQASLRTGEVLRLVMNKMPMPDENTSWEQIIDFRTDEDVKMSYLEMINWANNISLSNKTMSMIEEEFAYLYNKYMRHYRLHKMKSELTTWEVLISAGLDSLASFNPLGIVKELFKLRKSRISLMEDELKLPGREVAYIYKANKTFKY